MAKAKSAFVCNDCGADFPKWQGQCSECHAWNTLTEIRLSAPATKSGKARAAGRSGYAGAVAAVQRLEDVAVVDLPRLASGFDELDRVLGGLLLCRLIWERPRLPLPRMTGPQSCLERQRKTSMRKM